MDRVQKRSSQKVLDKMSEVDMGQQVMKEEFKVVKEQAQEGALKEHMEKLVEEEAPKEKTWISRWKNQWRGSNSLQAKEHLN